MKITINGLKAIESLTQEQANVFVAYGSDMYRQGMLKGALLFGIGVVVAQSMVITHEVRKCCKHKD